MKINKKNYIAVIVTVILLTICLGFYLLYKQVSTHTTESRPGAQKISLDPPTQSEIDDGQRVKQSTVDTNHGTDSQNSATPQQQKSVNMYVSAKNVSSSKVDIRVVIEGVHSGQCTIRLKNSDTVVSKQAGIQALATTSTCEGFTIPSSELSKGTWSYTITASLDGDSATAETSGDISLE